MLFLDLETTTLRKGLLPEKIHCCCISEDGDDPRNVEAVEFNKLIKKHKQLYAHNGIFFDYPVLEKLWGVDLSDNELGDTLVLSRVCAPMLRQTDDLTPKKFNGKHSLKSWGLRLGFPKDDYAGGWEELNDDMLTYCLQDVRVMVKVFQTLRASTFYDKEVLKREHAVHKLMANIYLDGIVVSGTDDLHEVIDKDMQDALKSIAELGFKGNPNSRQQVAKFLIEQKNWKPREFTPTKRPKINGDTLPEGSPFKKYYSTQKPISQLNGIIKKLVDTDHGKRLYPTISTSATRTSRATHTNPNIGQIPAVMKEDKNASRWDQKYGLEFRGLFKPEKGETIVGADLSSLELRCLAETLHIFGDSREWIDMLESGVDVHADNQKQLDLVNRTDAKRTIFLIVYGGGINPLAKIVGTTKKARQTMYRLKRNIKGYSKTKKLIEHQASKQKYVELLNGRKLFVVQPYTALNTYLQGLGAEVSKYWMMNIKTLMEERNIKANLLLYVHDEVEYSTKQPKELEKAIYDAVKMVKDQLGTEISFGCEVKTGIGKENGGSWRDVH